MPKIEACLHQYGIADLEAARALCLQHGIDVESIVKGIQPIAFDNAVWAYTIGTAVALAAGTREATEAARKIGEGLQAFTVPGSVAETREVGTGHGNLAAMLLDEDTRCFCLLAGHESFAAAEGGIGIVRSANKAPVKIPCVSSSMVWARIPATHWPALMALPIWKPPLTMPPRR